MSGKLALVTGGNRGLGFEVSKKLLKADCRVLLASRKLQDGKAAVQALEAEVPGASGRVTPIQLDVSQPSSIQEVAALVQRQYPQQIHILVNNAGILGTGWERELFDRTLATNAWGTMELTEALLPLLPDGASIVNVSSGLGYFKHLRGEYTAVPTAESVEALKRIVQFNPDSEQGQAGQMTPTYNVSKSVLNRFTQLLAVDERITSRSIRVNSVCPDWCRTDMGGSNATRSAEQGGESIFLATQVAETGKFWRDGRELAWSGPTDS